MDLEKFNSFEQIRQNNQKQMKLSQQKFNEQLNSLQLSKTQHPDLSSKYEGYMQISRRKIAANTNQEYFSSPFLKELKQKRNNMFSDQIIQKITKQYSFKEYDTFVNSRNYLPTNSKGDKYGAIELINYEELQKRMTRG